MTLLLTRKELSPAYFSDWKAEGSAGANVSIGAGPLSGGISLLYIPMVNSRTNEKITVSCRGLSFGVGVGPKVSVGISPSAMPSSGIGQVFAMPGMKKPFQSTWFKGYALAATVAGSPTGMVVGGYTVVIFTDTPSLVLDAADRTNAVLGYKAVCILKGTEISTSPASSTLAGMQAKVETRT